MKMYSLLHLFKMYENDVRLLQNLQMKVIYYKYTKRFLSYGWKMLVTFKGLLINDLVIRLKENYCTNLKKIIKFTNVISYLL